MKACIECSRNDESHPPQVTLERLSHLEQVKAEEINELKGLIK